MVGKVGRKDLPPSAGPPHVDDAAIALADCDFEALSVARGAIVEEPAAAVFPIDITEAATAKQPFTLRAAYRSPAVQAAANTDVDTDLSARLPGNRERRRQYCQRKHKWEERRSKHFLGEIHHYLQGRTGATLEMGGIGRPSIPFTKQAPAGKAFLPWRRQYGSPANLVMMSHIRRLGSSMLFLL
ncbi:hypothetical protein [Rhizobium sp. AC44/96]|uniref:hypothetical protein n=1 Tax=Rhizobium sp. AC44/96 TaxID=1841654 RepID=UPI0018E93D11|nr:hypothetical protein [Rhizobium sp. AC44/96]